jgi:four helix bundle protein
MDKNEAREKCGVFSVKLAQLYRHLSHNKKETVLSERLLASGANIGANLVRADCVPGKNEYLLKLYAGLQDCAETAYWLEVLYESDYLTEFEYNNLSRDCEELRQIFIMAIKNLRNALSAGTK